MDVLESGANEAISLRNRIENNGDCRVILLIDRLRLLLTVTLDRRLTTITETDLLNGRERLNVDRRLANYRR